MGNRGQKGPKPNVFTPSIIALLGTPDPELVISKKTPRRIVFTRKMRFLKKCEIWVSSRIRSTGFSEVRPGSANLRFWAFFDIFN